MRRFAVLIFGFLFFFTGVLLSAQQPKPEAWTPDIPESLVGPYIVDPATLAELDQDHADCANAGRLNFQCLVYRDTRSKMKSSDLESNPFEMDVFRTVRETVKKDIESIIRHPEFGGTAAKSLKPEFLEYSGAKIELVGVVNRMDRTFVPDKVPERGRKSTCGEISAIYRFGYEGDLKEDVPGDRHYESRLPVTMNVVFPAVPWAGGLTCAQVANRWLEYVEAVKGKASASKQLDLARTLVSSLKPDDVDRIELNMQGSRVPAGADNTDFGTLGTYIIRVFRWNTLEEQWWPSYLSNQIDRARFFKAEGDENSCEENRDTKLSRKALFDVLSTPAQIADIDQGLVIIPKPFLACRAVSISPGGATRSGNQPFWNAVNGSEQILFDDDIRKALADYKKDPANKLSFIGTEDEFRTRLNDASCSGCHQTRAIAGFHFPGADRQDIASVNAVFLPGSPHFFGDQLRRIEVLKLLAKGVMQVPRAILAASYAARPQNKFAVLKPVEGGDVPREKNMQLIGGWGGACMMTRPERGVRQWGCSGKLQCKPVFASANQPGIGMCVNPNDRPEIGEAMQYGTVSSDAFAFDKYSRVPPVPPAANGKPRDTTISTDHLPPISDNSYFAAHQEFYVGRGGIERGRKDNGELENDREYSARVRDQETGGFPGGALRLSECRNLPGEATCALLAASGFNTCLMQVGEGRRTPESCFRVYTNYAGVRACDPANPCRDDYICLRPMGYTKTNADAFFKERAAARSRAAGDAVLETEKNRKLLKINFFGEGIPDAGWLDRKGGTGDRRGVCIPPYFVFQFKADGHVVPKTRHQKGDH